MRRSRFALSLFSFSFASFSDDFDSYKLKQYKYTRNTLDIKHRMRTRHTSTSHHNHCLGPPFLSFISSTADAVTLSRAAGLTALQPRPWMQRVAAAVNCVAEGMRGNNVFRFGWGWPLLRHGPPLLSSPPAVTSALHRRHYATIKWKCGNCRTQLL